MIFQPRLKLSWSFSDVARQLKTLYGYPAGASGSYKNKAKIIFPAACLLVTEARFNRFKWSKVANSFWWNGDVEQTRRQQGFIHIKVHINICTYRTNEAVESQQGNIVLAKMHETGNAFREAVGESQWQIIISNC